MFRPTSCIKKEYEWLKEVDSIAIQTSVRHLAVEGNQIKLPKPGFVRFAKSREIERRLLSATIRRHPSGKYFVSLLCEVEIQPLPQVHQHVGVDLGIKHFAILSNGEPPVENPKYLHRYESQLARWQRIFSRRKKDGKNREKARIKVARLHEKIRNTRQDFLHKLSTKLIRENQTICL
ncbi:RNA-guided endonuclease TnpB family protein, partial [Aneurinibacillus sp. UBA3580]|uniref:RNA-guided endonuclease TnpB family protein n=1 Tax=Aneurinibacillus sp. UBA3580 TaxID=1946041 RepID=UPI0039C880E8